MQALSDEQQLERMEKKVDDGFAETKAEFRALRAELGAEVGAVRSELRTEVGAVRTELGAVRSEVGATNRSLHAMWLTMIIGFAGMGVAMILGFAGILLQHHL